MGDIVDYAESVNIAAIQAIVDNLPNNGSLLNLALTQAIADNLPNDGSLTNLALIRAIVDNLPNDGSLTNLATIRSLLNVPDPDGVLNATINEVIGNRSDGNNTNTLHGLLGDVYEEIHTAQLVYPTMALGALVTAHADAWTPGAFAEVVPINTITGEFHIHHICVCSASANGDYEVILYHVETEIGRFTFTRSDKKDDVEGIDLFTPHCAANSQIQAKLASSNAASEDTVRLKLWYHPH